MVMTLLAVILAGFAWLGISMRRYDPAAGNLFIVTALVIMPLIWVARRLLNRYLLWRAWRRKEGFFLPAKTTLSTDGIYVHMPHASSHVAWSFFSGYQHEGDTVILHHTNGWILMCRSRFASDEEWDRFVSFVHATFAPVGRA